MWFCAFGSTEDMNNHVVAVVLLVKASNFKLGYTVQLLEVIRERCLNGVLIDIVL